mgnify:FL=1
MLSEKFLHIFWVNEKIPIEKRIKILYNRPDKKVFNKKKVLKCL